MTEEADMGPPIQRMGVKKLYVQTQGTTGDTMVLLTAMQSGSALG
jgi:hypothetical protein